MSNPQLESAVGISVCATRVFMPRAAVFAWWERGHRYVFASACGHPAGYHVSLLISSAFWWLNTSQIRSDCQKLAVFERVLG